LQRLTTIVVLTDYDDEEACRPFACLVAFSAALPADRSIYTLCIDLSDTIPGGWISTKFKKKNKKEEDKNHSGGTVHWCQANS
jgi:hypothetical protein